MIEINLFDEEFRHLIKEDGYFSLTDDRRPTHFKYTIRKKNWDGITIFTDRMMFSNDVDEVESKYKIGWIIETRETNPHLFNNLPFIIDKFDFIMTYDG